MREKRGVFGCISHEYPGKGHIRALFFPPNLLFFLKHWPAFLRKPRRAILDMSGFGIGGFMRLSRVLILLVAAIAMAGIATATESTSSSKKLKCPKKFPAASSMAEDLARNVERNASSIVVETVGNVQRMLRVKMKVTVSTGEVKLLDKDLHPVEGNSVTLDGAEIEQKTVLGNHVTVVAPTGATGNYGITVAAANAGYQCEYKLTASFRAKTARKVWQEGGQEKSENISNFKKTSASITKRISLNALAAKAHR